MLPISIEEENLFSLNKILQKNKKNDNNIIFYVYAPMPGLISKINKNTNDIIEKNDILLIVEAMKMENEIKSNVDGIIKEVFIKEKQSVQKNTLLMSITLK